MNRKKIITISIILLVAFLTVSYFYDFDARTVYNPFTDELIWLPISVKEYLKEGGYVPPDGFVPDEETAKKIAEAVWIPIYGEDVIHSQRPYAVENHEKDDCWYVRGTFPKPMLGGVAEIIIKKSTGEILYVYHGV